MADNSILTPGYQDPTDNIPIIKETEQYLVKDNYLSEYRTEEEKSVVRENLNVPSKEYVYSKDDVDTQISEKIRNTIQEYLNMEDPHGILPTVEEMIADMVKTDGSTPFTMPQAGKDPQSDYHLTTKKYVDKLIREHLNANDPHNILEEVAIQLAQYVKNSDIYSKDQLYTKQEIDNQSSQYVNIDGTTPFRKAQIGVDPSIDGHLATKRYVDKVLYNHLVDVDPHNFLTTLNQRLSYYIKKKDVYDKTQTYSRTQIDSIINKSVSDTIDIALQDYMDSVNDKFEYIRKQKYIKQDGSVPFSNPQIGVEATEDNHLVTLKQLKDLESTLDEQISTQPVEWLTSGPAQVAVGNVKEGHEFPDTMTLQEVMDAIFYGDEISLTVPEYVNITETGNIIVCINGSTANVEYAEVLQNGEVIATFVGEDFEDRCVTIKSNPILEDSEITFRVTYLNGAVHEDTKTIKCSTPIFIGVLPKYKFAHTITFEYLQQLCDGDPINNKFYSEGQDVKEIIHQYDFSGKEMKHLFIVVPLSYPNLKQMSIPSQQFNIEAFEVIDNIPLSIPKTTKDTIYKIYVYRQALTSANQETTFKFE